MVPDAKKWALKFQKAGYQDMDEVADCDFDAVFEELPVPSGIQKKLRDGLQQFKDGTIGQNSMPQGDLDATAPTQKEDGVNWWFWGGLAASAVLVAASGGVLIAVVAAEQAAAAAAAQAAAAAAAAQAAGTATAVGTATAATTRASSA